MEDHEIDEVAANLLIAEGMDVPTAVAGSIKGDLPTSNVPAVVGMVAALLVAGLLAYLLL